MKVKNDALTPLHLDALVTGTGRVRGWRLESSRDSTLDPGTSFSPDKMILLVRSKTIEDTRGVNAPMFARWSHHPRLRCTRSLSR